VAKRAVKSKERSQSLEGEEKEGGGKLTTPTSDGPTLATLPVVREDTSVLCLQFAHGCGSAAIVYEFSLEKRLLGSRPSHEKKKK
jgi:hypothetical protein